MLKRQDVIDILNHSFAGKKYRFKEVFGTFHIEADMEVWNIRIDPPAHIIMKKKLVELGIPKEHIGIRVDENGKEGSFILTAYDEGGQSYWTI